MSRRKSFYVTTLVLGICLIITGFFVKVKEVSGIMLGVGAGLLGMSVSRLYTKHIEDKNPAIKKQIEIEYKDERSTMIRDRAKAKSADITQWLIVTAAYITILISAPLWVTLAVIMVYLAYHIITLYYMNKYQKEM